MTGNAARLARHLVQGLWLAGALALLGCHQDQPVARLAVPTRQLQLPPGSHTTLVLRWDPLVAIPRGEQPVVFLHMLDGQRNVVRTFDHELRSTWKVGQEITDAVGLYHSAIGPALPPGSYALTVGLYTGKKRYALQMDGGEASPHHEYTIGQVQVPDSAGGPGFTFSPQWLPVEPGGDRQTVARRWLSGDGSIDVHGLQPGSRVWMVLRLPRVEPPLRLVREAGAAVPLVVVRQDCGGFSATVSGDGFHELSIPIPAASCRITFDSNFVVLEMGSGRKLSVALEQLGWDAGAGSGTASP